MNARELQVGDVLQINPNKKFGSELLVCTEPKSWGCQGYLMMARIEHACRFDRRAFLNVRFEDMEFVGRLHWIEDQDKEKDERS